MILNARTKALVNIINLLIEFHKISVLRLERPVFFITDGVVETVEGLAEEELRLHSFVVNEAEVTGLLL